MNEHIQKTLAKAIELHNAGMVEFASILYEAVIKLQPDNADANHNMGLLKLNTGHALDALCYFQTALKKDTSNAQFWISSIKALIQLERRDEAIRILDQANASGLESDEFRELQKQLKPKPYAATTPQIRSDGLIHSSTDIKGPEKETIADLINCFDKKQFARVVEKGNEITKKFSTSCTIWNILGAALSNLGRPYEASLAFRKATDLNPKFAGGFNNLGVSLEAQGNTEDAIKNFERAIALKIDYPEALNNLGSALKNLGRLEAAAKMLKKAIILKPNYAAAYYNLGNVFAEQNELEEAVKTYDKALKLRPNYPDALAQKMRHQASICDWTEFLSNFTCLKDLSLSGKHIGPFFALSLEDNPEQHLSRSKAFVIAKYQNYKPSHTFVRPSKNPPRLHIGYFSSGFHAHPVNYLMSQIIKRHNRGSFKVFGYSLGPPVFDKMRAELSKSFDVFRDLNDSKDDEIIKLAHEDRLDIAIDLTGHTSSTRSGIFALRPAPIQINYLGYPGSMGANFIDYIIADENLIPVEDRKYYVEKPIYLPHQYQAQDDELQIAHEVPSRTSLGLPEREFVFCAINATYKITPKEFDIWMRLLKNVPGSVLWLFESNKWAKENLINEAIVRGIPPDRLIFAKRVQHDQYLAQFRQADLYLDTFNYNAGATASNALWAGLPVLTKRGKSYTSRMASSLLLSVGLSELITNSEAEYEELALELAQNPERLTSLKNDLSDKRINSPLFDSNLFTKHLENGYQQAYQRYYSGKETDAIFVPKC